MANGDILTNSGKKLILNRAVKGTPDYAEVTVFKVGMSNSTPDVSDTDLDHPVPISGTEAVDSCDAADWTDDAEMTESLNNTTFKEGTGSINLTKDAGANATASCDKTTTSLTFTSKALSLWLYIKDATALAKLAVNNCLTIRFGNDNGNYWYWQKDLADLAVGWNLIDGLTSATADGTQGAPAGAACDYSYIGLTATGAAIVWSAGDFIMDDWKLIETADYTKVYSSGYPTLDETNHEVEYRGTLTSTEANGYSLDGVGLFNADGTPLMMLESTYTDESKSNTDQFIYIVKMRIV